MHAAGPFAQVSLQQRGKGGGTEGASGCCCPARPPSQLLQAAVHLPFALFPCPGPALGAELLQVFFEVLVVHGPVAGGLTVRLQTGEDEMRGPWLTRGSRLPPSGLARWGAAPKAQHVPGPFFVQGRAPEPGRDTAMTTSQIRLSELREGGTVPSRDFPLPGISGRTPYTRPSGHTAQGSGVWDTRYQADLSLLRTGTCQEGRPRHGELFRCRATRDNTVRALGRCEHALHSFPASRSFLQTVSVELCIPGHM